MDVGTGLPDHGELAMRVAGSRAGPGPAEVVVGGCWAVLIRQRATIKKPPSSRMEAGGWTAAVWLAGGSQIMPTLDKG